MKQIHLKVRSARESKGYTQEKLASMIGVTDQTIIRWEKNIDEGISLGNINRLLSVLDINELVFVMRVKG